MSCRSAFLSPANQDAVVQFAEPAIYAGSGFTRSESGVLVNRYIDGYGDGCQ